MASFNVNSGCGNFTQNQLPTQSGNTGLRQNHPVPDLFPGFLSNPAQTQNLQNLFDDPLFANYLEQLNPGEQSPQAAHRKPGDTTLIEVGYTPDGKADRHAQSVEQVFKRYNDKAPVHFVGIEDTSPSVNRKDTANAEDSGPELKDQKALDQIIDHNATDAYNRVGNQINEVVKAGGSSVINGSLGYSRNDIYQDVAQAAVKNPQLAQALGLNEQEITSLKKNDPGSDDLPPKVADAISGYVDQRLDAPDSAFRKARQEYQQITGNAADHGVTVVVAAGNDHALNSVFARGGKSGGDTNFLAQSDSVISVAAADNQGTASTADDQIAGFSSRGDGRYNPTLATDGVGVETSFGKKNGTSFAAPKVAAVIAKIQQDNPNLTFEQIKNLLQQTATQTPAPSVAEGAGIFNPDAAIQAAADF